MSSSVAWHNSDEIASLAGQLRAGHAAAERRFVELFERRIRVVAEVRTRDRELARELTQDVLMAAIAGVRAGQLREGEKLGAFVYGIARNCINNHLRRQRRRPIEQEIEEGDAVYNPIEADERRERVTLVRMAMKQVSEDDRRILGLTLVDGLKPGEIATRLGLSDEVVRARKSRALKRVADLVRRMSRI